MNTSNHKPHYEARIRVGEDIIYKTEGDAFDALQAFISDRCNVEKTGAEGEIIDLTTGKIIYHCQRQTIVDQ